MRSAFGRLSIAQRGPFHDAPVAAPRETNHARASDIKPYAVQKNISLEAKVGSRRLREFSGMPRLSGGPKIPGIDPVAVARRQISDQRTGVPQRTEVLYVRGDVIEASYLTCELSLPRRRSVRRRRNSISSSGISTRRSASSFWARAKMPWSTIGSAAVAPPGPKRYPDS